MAAGALKYPTEGRIQALGCGFPQTYDLDTRPSAGDSESDPVVPALGNRPGVVNALVLLKIALCVYLAFLTLFTAWLRPSFFALFWSILLGIVLGFAYSWVFYSTRYSKRLLSEGVSSHSSYIIQPCML